MQTTSRAYPLPDILPTVLAKVEAHPLPMLKQTVTQILALASTTTSDIGELTQTILQDQALTTRVLRVANSAMYYRGQQEPITTITRALVLIGWRTLRELVVGTQFADMAQQQFSENAAVKRLLSKALVSAHQAAALSQAHRTWQDEELFASTLLASVGEVAVAAFLPQVHAELERVQHTESLSWEAAYQRVTGYGPHEITAAIMAQSQLSTVLISGQPDWEREANWGREERRKALVGLANGFAANLLGPASPEADRAYDQMVTRAQQALELPPDAVAARLRSGVQQALILGTALDLDMASCLCGGGEAAGPRGHLLASCRPVDAPAVTPVSEAPLRVEPSVTSASVLQLLTILNEFSLHLLTTPDMNTIMSYMLEGLHRGAGFDHVVLLLQTSDQSQLLPRRAIGPQAEALMAHCRFSMKALPGPLAACLQSKAACRISSEDELQVCLPSAIREGFTPQWIALGPLCVGGRTLGCIWADRGGQDPDTEEVQWRAFQLFMAQANLGLLRLVR
jgi:hypothetical protein